jgi:predicted nucleotidyltransferase
VLDLKQVDLRSLGEALEDHSDTDEWWLDPATGEVEPWRADHAFDEPDEERPSDRGWIFVEPIPPQVGYGDMEDFIARVRDSRARDLLQRAIAGRGAFRRFKDTLFEFPELREAWFKFRDARMERRAIEWLADEELVDRKVAERAITERPDPDLPAFSGAFDAEDIARAVARDLRELYGERLKNVLLFGSWARGDAHPESDIDLLVVLHGIESGWAELRRMDDILWRHSFENDTVVTALPVTEDDFDRARKPVLARAQAEGRPVG